MPFPRIAARIVAVASALRRRDARAQRRILPLRAIEREICACEYQDAVRRGDTRAQHRLWRATTREVLAADLREAQRMHRPTRDLQRRLKAATNEALKEGLRR